MLGDVNKLFVFKCPAMFCLYTSSKLSRQKFEFSLKVMGLNSGYLLKSKKGSNLLEKEMNWAILPNWYFLLLLRNVCFLQKNYLKEQKGPGQVQWTTQHWQRANKHQVLCECASLLPVCHLPMLKSILLTDWNTQKIQYIFEFSWFFWSRFYIVILGSTFFRHLLFTFHIIFGLLFTLFYLNFYLPLSIWTFVSHFYLDFYFFFRLLFLFWSFFSLSAQIAIWPWISSNFFQKHPSFWGCTVASVANSVCSKIGKF